MVSYDIAHEGQAAVSTFSSSSNAMTAKYPLKDAKIGKNSFKISSSEFEANAGLGGECFPLPVAYMESSSQSYHFEIKGNTLKAKAKFVDKGIMIIIPYRDAQTISCEMVKVN